MNFTLYNEQNRRQDNAHRPRTGNPALLLLICSDGSYNHANPFGNGRGRNQSVSSALLVGVNIRAGTYPRRFPNIELFGCA